MTLQDISLANNLSLEADSFTYSAVYAIPQLVESPVKQPEEMSVSTYCFEFDRVNFTYISNPNALTKIVVRNIGFRLIRVLFGGGQYSFSSKESKVMYL